MASQPATLAPWQQRQNDGAWSRPLVGPEKMFDEWLEVVGWTEWIGAIIFSSSFPSAKNTSKAHVEEWFKRALTRLCLEKPSLLATIERGQGSSASSKDRAFVYRPLADNDDISQRIDQRTTVVHTEKSVEDGLKSVTDDFYHNPGNRISIELGDHLVHFSFVVSSAEPGKFGLAVRNNHSLVDFWGGMAIFDNILDKLAADSGEASAPSFKEASTSSLHPCYLDILQEPLGSNAFDASMVEKAQYLLGSNLQNITFCPIGQGATNNPPNTDYPVRRQVYSEETTKKIMQICKANGVTVTALLTAIQTLALLRAFPPPDPSRTSAAPICVSNRLRQTALAHEKPDSDANPLGQLARKAADIGPVMSTTFLVSPFDAAPFLGLDTAKDGWKESVWKVAQNVHEATTQATSSNISEHLEWTQGPASFGAVAGVLEAVKGGHAPAPPGMFTPLSSAGLLDGIHLKGSYGAKGEVGNQTLKLDDFSFYSRVNNLFGPQTWVWTALGKLNLILVLPDPRVCAADNLGWWDDYKDMITKIAVDTV
ncbi:l- -diaminobutyrate decarboxylase [Fusarium albosuccineum]|uniref:L- -diaminobutyrate decarboxylase n=1 Tax=Fusarium albosuccineum TaxID=1237068 RepID=A0A8H4PK57_9HYPO|nr:l- -diaminobutyrate decarboxylase [Fusarium albosuccineum]